MSNTKKELVKIEDYLVLSKSYYKSCGMDPFTDPKEKSLSDKILQLIIFIVCFGNISITVLCETIYLYKAMGSFSTFLEATALAPCIGFCILTMYKLGALWMSRDIIMKFINTMRDMIPQTEHDQVNLKTSENQKRTTNFERGYAFVLMLVIWVFNVSSVLQTIIEYEFLGMPFLYRYAYYLWYPFEVSTPIVYTIIYAHQIHAGLIAAGGTLACDLLFISMVMLCCMQFDYMAREIGEMVPQGNQNDIVKLNQIIQHHQVVLEMSSDINEIFSMTVLFNFLSSSMIICLVGFQVTAHVPVLVLFKYVLFLAFELIQVGTICYLGNKLIDSSTGIAEAAFNQPWFQGNSGYRKALLLIIVRSQKPAIINAKSFAVVSLESFTKVLSSSYQFFALLRTMYSQ